MADSCARKADAPLLHDILHVHAVSAAIVRKAIGALKDVERRQLHFTSRALQSFGALPELQLLRSTRLGVLAALADRVSDARPYWPFISNYVRKTSPSLAKVAIHECDAIARTFVAHVIGIPRL